MAKRGVDKDIKFSLEFNVDGLNSVLRAFEKKKRSTLETLDNFRKRFSRYEEPSCEIRQTHKGMKIELKLPEVRKKDILLKLAEDKIEVKAESRTRDRKIIKTFHRIIDIPKCSQPKKIKAKFINEKLKLEVPYSLK